MGCKMIKIVCAAVKLGYLVIPCIRHWDENCHRIAENVFGAGRVHYMIRDGQEVQGFLDNKGRFYDRKEAAEIYNQYAENKVGKMLFSEDLY